jgi:hypothetical protein
VSSPNSSQSAQVNPFVELYDFCEDEPVMKGRVELTSHGIVFSPRGFSQRMIDMFHSRGIHDATGNLVKPAAGMPFLRALRCEFSGSYFRASRVKGVRCRVLRFSR